MFYKAATRGIFLCNRKTDKNEVKGTDKKKTILWNVFR